MLGYDKKNCWFCADKNLITENFKGTYKILLKGPSNNTTLIRAYQRAGVSNLRVWTNEIYICAMPYTNRLNMKKIKKIS